MEINIVFNKSVLPRRVIIIRILNEGAIAPKLFPRPSPSTLPLLCLTPHREEDGADVSFSAALMLFAFPALDYCD